MRLSFRRQNILETGRQLSFPGEGPPASESPATPESRRDVASCARSILRQAPQSTAPPAQMQYCWSPPSLSIAANASATISRSRQCPPGRQEESVRRQERLADLSRQSAPRERRRGQWQF